MHIERQSLQDLSAMPISRLCDIDLEYKRELERLMEDRGVMRTILAAKAREEGLSANQAVERHVRALNKAEIKGVPSGAEIKA